MEKVSVIVPIYNVEEYLSICLESIVNQDYKNLEVIMVNDSSQDESRNIAEIYEKTYGNFRLVDRENGGLSAARNTGLK